MIIYASALLVWNSLSQGHVIHVIAAVTGFLIDGVYNNCLGAYTT